MRLLFIGHTLHLNSRSSDFFVRFLEGFAQVSSLYVLPETFDDASLIESLDFSSFDAVVLWQVDFLARFFLSRGCATIVVPMLDASAGLPSVHWVSMKGALIISFSRDIHILASRNGISSVYVRYFPQALVSGWDQDFGRSEPLSLFFWERNPSSSLDAARVIRSFSPLVDHIHIHRSGKRLSGKLLSLDGLAGLSQGARVTCSSWFSNRESLQRVLLASQIYVAPRLCEGIGHAFLEAMAAGRLVVAHDAGTHSDYISHGRNGYLVDFEKRVSASRLDFSLAARSAIRERLAVDVRRYADAWEECYMPCLRASIVEYVNGYSRDHALCDTPFPAMYCFAAHQDVCLYVAMLELSRRSLGRQVARSGPLGWALEALDAYGLGALPLIRDMLQRPLVAEDLNDRQSILDLLSRMEGLRELASLYESEGSAAH